LRLTRRRQAETPATGYKAAHRPEKQPCAVPGPDGFYGGKTKARQGARQKAGLSGPPQNKAQPMIKGRINGRSAPQVQRFYKGSL